VSAELLRRAATEMRERADSATGAPWQCIPVEDEDGAADSYVIALTGHTSIGEDVGESMTLEDAEHIASWDPVMARVTADLLDSGADEIERRVARYGEQILERANHVFDAMIALARTYLDEVA
jgi:hypothetical protein